MLQSRPRRAWRTARRRVRSPNRGVRRRVLLLTSFRPRHWACDTSRGEPRCCRGCCQRVVVGASDEPMTWELLADDAADAERGGFRVRWAVNTPPRTTSAYGYRPGRADVAQRSAPALRIPLRWRRASTTCSTSARRRGAETPPRNCCPRLQGRDLRLEPTRRTASRPSSHALRS